MLDHKQFEDIMNRKDLTKVDLILIGDHLEYIEKVHDDYGEDLPYDVHQTLMSDARAIVDRLEVEYKKLKEINDRK